MEAGIVIMAIVLIVAAAGLYFAVKSGGKKKQKELHGMLNVVYDEFNENPQLMLALYDPVEDIVGRKQVLFEVNVIRQNSQK